MPKVEFTVAVEITAPQAVSLEAGIAETPIVTRINSATSNAIILPAATIADPEAQELETEQRIVELQDVLERRMIPSQPGRQDFTDGLG